MSWVFSPVAYPVGDVFWDSWCAHSRLCLPQSLLDATAIKEHILFLRVAMEITEDLQWSNKGEKKKIQVMSIGFLKVSSVNFLR